MSDPALFRANLTSSEFLQRPADPQRKEPRIPLRRMLAEQNSVVDNRKTGLLSLRLI